MIALRVLGPIEADVDGVPVDLGGPRQRAVLALLLAEHGRVLSVDRMIAELWRGEPPPRAIASLQAYISNLRRLLEPNRPRRAPAKVLVSAAPGYMIRLSDQAVDAWHFECLVRDARDVARRSDLTEAKRLLDKALALWRGSAYAEVADEEWAVVEVARLVELHTGARELHVDMMLRTGRGAEAVAAAEVLVRQHPLREEGWRLLALSLWSSGRQADALGALRRARRQLGEELGLDPDRELIDLEHAILSGRLDVLDDATVHRAAVAETHQLVPTEPGADVFVGRDGELHAVAQVSGAARRVGGVVLITGEAGVGKSRLLARIRDDLDVTGWTTVVGRCPESEGAPPAWAWVEALRRLAVDWPPTDGLDALAPLLREGHEIRESNASTGRFQLHRAVSGWLRAVASVRPLVIFLDDLHKGDGETLALLETLATDLDGTPVLIIAAYRPMEADNLTPETLARLARRSPARIALTGLARPDVDRLVMSVCGGSVDPETLDALAERTGGNPFYVRESAHLLASEGALVAISEVPEGVRDVLRRRLARLPTTVVSVLRLAAVFGRNVNVDVLIDAADVDELTVRDALDAGVITGLLEEPQPGRVSFVHVLARETLYHDMTKQRRSVLHRQAAEAVRRTYPEDLTALAHHYEQSASVETAALAMEYAIRAADLATGRYAHSSAVVLLGKAIDAFERTPRDGQDRDAQRIDLLGRLLRAQVRAGAIDAARSTRQKAIDVATTAGRDDLLAAVFAAWSEFTPWQIRSYGWVDRPVVNALDRLLRRTNLDARTRIRLLDALVSELEGEDDPRVASSAAEALLLARQVADPRLLALALAASCRAAHVERDCDIRSAFALELADLARRHDMPSYQWYSAWVAAATAANKAEVADLRTRLGEALDLAQRYHMAEPEAVTRCGIAMLEHIAGRYDEAEQAYSDAHEQMRDYGALHGDGFHALAILTLRLSQDRLAEYEPYARTLFEQFGGLAADVWALTLISVGRTDDARAVRTHASPIRRDYYETIFTMLRAMAVVRLGEVGEAASVMDRLIPARDQMAGASSTSLALGPVAQCLGELCLLLDRPEDAREHFHRAVQVAERWGSTRWAARARAALASM